MQKQSPTVSSEAMTLVTHLYLELQFQPALPDTQHSPSVADHSQPIDLCVTLHC